MWKTGLPAAASVQGRGSGGSGVRGEKMNLNRDWKRKSGTPLAFSLPRRLLGLFLVFVVSIYIAGIWVTVKLERDAFREIRQMYLSRVSSLTEQLDDELERIQLQINYVTTRPDVRQMELTAPTVTFSRIYATVLRVGELMYALQNSSGLVEDAGIFLPRLGKVVSSDGSYRAFSDEDESFIQEYREKGGREILMTVNGQLFLVSDSMYISSTEQASLIRVRLSERVISEWCGRFSENSLICLLGAARTESPYFLGVGNALLSEEEFLADLKKAAEQQEAGKKTEDDSTVWVAGTEYLRLAVPVGERDLWVSGYVDIKVLRNASRPFALWQFVLTAFLLLEVILFFYIIRKMISQPINRFMGEVQSLEEKGVIRLSEPPGSNMDFLYSAFLGVSEKLKASLEQAYNNKLLACQSEIKYLQAQINPHFLYNSFYHLYRMAKMEDTEGVAEMSRRLSSYYRYITRCDQNVVPLSMEYENIKDYTEIQMIRFGDRIKVELEPLPTECAGLEVPRFVLQPLFENAYDHGVEKITGGLIRLRFEACGGKLAVIVENNGACADEDMEAVSAYLENSGENRVMTALKNVKSRMQLLGGDLTVSHGSLGGFCATLILPCREDQPG